jgi:hypothetical protein
LFFPSKLADYMGTDRRVVAVTPPGTAARIVQQIGGWVCDPGAPEQVAAALVAAVETLRSGGAPLTPSERERRASYTATRTAQAFSNVVAGVLDRRVTAAPGSAPS